MVQTLAQRRRCWADVKPALWRFRCWDWGGVWRGFRSICPALHRSSARGIKCSWTHCWINVGPASATLDQHWSNSESMYRGFLVGGGGEAVDHWDRTITTLLPAPVSDAADNKLPIPNPPCSYQMSSAVLNPIRGPLITDLWSLAQSMLPKTMKSRLTL